MSERPTGTAEAEAVRGYMRDRSRMVESLLALRPQIMTDADGNGVGVIESCTQSWVDALEEHLAWVDSRVKELTTEYNVYHNDGDGPEVRPWVIKP